MDHLKNKIITFFSLTKSEFNGLFIMLILLIVSFFIPSIYFCFKPLKPYPVMELEALKKQLDFNAKKRPEMDTSARKSYKNTIKSTHFYDFDPNNASISDWKSFGLSEKQAKVILNYVQKGGVFHSKADLKRMFVISDERYNALKPYIKINKKQVFQVPNKNEMTSQLNLKNEKRIDINSADTTDLKKIKGIGTSFANRILKYRNRLGGFYSLEQLKEVYGLNEILYQNIVDQCYVNTDVIEKININTCDFQSLRKIPYLNHKQIKVILEYRNEHGKFFSLEDLKKIVVLSPDLIDKLKAYFIYD